MATNVASNTPASWKLKGSQYGKLKTWRIANSGTFVAGVRLSEVTKDNIQLAQHHSFP